MSGIQNIINNPQSIRLGINIDHIATLRNARQGTEPSLMRAARDLVDSGADIITVHLREDRRHINDQDVIQLQACSILPINLEMAATEEMIAFALKVKPRFCCIVPEKRQELTTEGALDACSLRDTLRTKVRKLIDAGISVSLFVNPDPKQLIAAHEIGVSIVELTTGPYCLAHAAGDLSACSQELDSLKQAAQYGRSLGLQVHAGHGLSYYTVVEIAQIPEVSGLHIGHFIIGESIFVGLGTAVAHMKDIIYSARKIKIA